MDTNRLNAATKQASLSSGTSWALTSATTLLAIKGKFEKAEGEAQTRFGKAKDAAAKGWFRRNAGWARCIP